MVDMNKIMETEKTTNHELTLNFQKQEDLYKFLDHINILANNQKMPLLEISEIMTRCKHGININLDLCEEWETELNIN